MVTGREARRVLRQVARGGAVSTQQSGRARAVSDTLSHKFPLSEDRGTEPLEVRAPVFYPSVAKTEAFSASLRLLEKKKE